MDLTDVTAFVTGAGQGIGREISIALAAAGAAVALTDVTDRTGETAAIIDDRVGGEAETLALHCDVTDEDSVAEAVAATVDAFGGLDCLVNNAGIAGPTAPVEEVAVADFEATLAVNLVGPLTVAKHAAPHLRESDRASLINVSSIGGKIPYPDRTAYAASKAGLVGLSRTLSHELADDDVAVNTVNPGAVDGPRADAVLRARAEESGRTYEAERADELATIPMGEMVSAGEIAEFVVFLASRAVPHLTSQDVSVAGGTVWW